MNIDKILKEHRVWLETNGKDGVMAFLPDANLSGAFLTETDYHRGDVGNDC